MPPMSTGVVCRRVCSMLPAIRSCWQPGVVPEVLSWIGRCCVASGVRDALLLLCLGLYVRSRAQRQKGCGYETQKRSFGGPEACHAWLVACAMSRIAALQVWSSPPCLLFWRQRKQRLGNQQERSWALSRMRFVASAAHKVRGQWDAPRVCKDLCCNSAATTCMLIFALTLLRACFVSSRCCDLHA